jgi:uncharacterized protein (TIGR00255 family)
MTPKTLYSMTGFGEYFTPAPIEGYRITAKSLNHRNLEVQVSLPREWDHLDLGIRKIVSQDIQRGRVEITVSRIDHPTSRDGGWLPKAIDAYRDLHVLKDMLGIPDPVTLDQVLMHLSHERSPSYQAIEPKDGLSSASQAVARLLESRKTEGRALGQVILDLANEVQDTVAQIERKRPRTLEKTHAQFVTKLKDLTRDVIAPDSERRLEEEALFYLSRKDNEEEWQRLKIHLTRFKQDLSEGGSIGKSLDFLIQEMQREINTFITKEAHPEIFQPAMGIRNTLTKLKEQIQNVE